MLQDIEKHISSFWTKITFLKISYVIN
jgi:hypothetical protein